VEALRVETMPSELSPARAQSALRRQQALALRRRGLGFREIGEQLGISTSGAHKCVRTALTEVRQKYQEDAAELIELEKERLDTLQAAYWPDALAGDVQAAHVVLACTAQRRKLLGLDAPKLVEVDQTIRSGLSEQQLLLLAEAVGLDKLMVIDQTKALPISVPAAGVEQPKELPAAPPAARPL